MAIPALENKPELDVILRFYYDEYNAIAQDRNTDQGQPKPITTGQIIQYCNFFSVENRFEFFEYIRLIDRVYLTEYYKRQKTAESNKPVKVQ